MRFPCTAYSWARLLSLLAIAHLCCGMMRRHVSSSRTILSKLGALNASFNVVLASASPRRKELLQVMGINTFSCVPSGFAETLDKSSFATAADYCMKTSEMKVEDVIATHFASSCAKNTVIIGADTVVVIDDLVLEKPKDDGDAKRMMLLLSGRTHQVHTAVTVYTNALSEDCSVRQFASFVETTSVTFASLGEDDITAYIASGEGADKAGGYGVQGLGSNLVKSLTGCYFNVMGLPIHALSSTLSDLVHQATLRSEPEL